MYCLTGLTYLVNQLACRGKLRLKNLWNTTLLSDVEDINHEREHKQEQKQHEQNNKKTP